MEKKQETAPRYAPAPVTPVSTRLGSAIFDFTPASMSLRVGAGLLDLLLLSLVGLVPVWFAEFRFPHSIPAWLPLVTLFGLGLLYFTACFSFKGRTVGQWYFGLMISTTAGHEVWPTRGFFFALLTLLTGWFLPIMIVSPGHRSLADLLCGVRTIRDRVLNPL